MRNKNTKLPKTIEKLIESELRFKSFNIVRSSWQTKKLLINIFYFLIVVIVLLLFIFGVIK